MNEMLPYRRENNKVSTRKGLSSLLNQLNNENLLPILLLGLLSKSGQLRGNTEDYARSAEMLRVAKPYFKDIHKEALSKAEGILDVMYSLNRLVKGEYKEDDSYHRTYYDEANKPLKILEAVRPHIKGKGRETIDRVLLVDDRIKRIKNASGERKKIIENFEYMTDILEVLQTEKGKEARQMINKVKQIVEIIRK